MRLADTAEHEDHAIYEWRVRVDNTIGLHESKINTIMYLILMKLDHDKPHKVVALSQF